MDAAIQSFASGIDNFMINLVAATVILVVSVTVYVLLTPMKEIELWCDQKNGLAALSLAGVIMGLSIPLSAALATSLSVFELLIWGVVALLLQLIAFRAVDFLVKDLSKRIEEGTEVGTVVLLISVKLSTGLLLAAALFDPALARLG